MTPADLAKTWGYVVPADAWPINASIADRLHRSVVTVNPNRVLEIGAGLGSLITRNAAGRLCTVMTVDVNWWRLQRLRRAVTNAGLPWGGFYSWKTFQPRLNEFRPADMVWVAPGNTPAAMVTASLTAPGGVLLMAPGRISIGWLRARRFRLQEAASDCVVMVREV